MIDYDKPIEYLDGSPATYLGTTSDGHYRVTVKGDPNRRSGNFYDINGKHVYGTHGNIRNVKAPEIDLTKPLYVDGVRVYPLFGHSWPKDAGGGRRYVNVSRKETHTVDNSTFFLDGDQLDPKSPNAIKGYLSNNPGDTNMLDLNKPLTVNGKDAKVIHTFDNGNVVCVVDGSSIVRNFNKSGDPVDNNISSLKNKVEVKVLYQNFGKIQPGAENHNAGLVRTNTNLKDYSSTMLAFTYTDGVLTDVRIV